MEARFAEGRGPLVRLVGLALLTTMPFYALTAPNPALSGNQALVALGLCAGFVLARVVPDGLARRLRAAGVVALASLASVEWALCLSLARMSRYAWPFDMDWFASFRHAWLLATPVLAFASALALSSCPSGEETRLPRGASCGLDEKKPSGGGGLAAIAAGFLVRGLSYAVTAVVDGRMAPGRLWTTGFSPVNLVVIPVASLILLGVSATPDGKLDPMPMRVGVGSFAWWSLTRVIPLGQAVSWPYALLSLIAVACWLPRARCLFALSAHGAEGRRSHSAEPEPSFRDGHVRPDEEAREALLGLGLAPRELEVAVGVVCGGSSREVGELLGVKPATVRSTMARVYKKASVTGRKALLELIGMSDRQPAAYGHSDGEESGRLAAEGSTGARRVPASAASRPLEAAVATALLLPWGITLPAWGAGRPLVYGAALACLMTGGASLAGCHPSEGRRASRVALALASMLSLGMARFAVGVGGYWIPFELTGALLGTAMLIELLLQQQTEAVLGGWGRWDSLAGWAMLLTSLCMGAAWEETWRVGPWFAASLQTTVFLLLVTTGGLYLLASERQYLRMALALALLAVSLLSNVRASLFALAAASCALLGRRFARAKSATPGPSLPLVAFGLGVVAADVLVNRVGFLMVGNEVLTRPFGGRGAFGGIFLSSSLLLALCAGTTFACLCRSVEVAERLRGSLDRSGLTRERTEHLLLGLGFGQTEAEVASDIAYGYSSQKICERRFVSRGTVNTARRAVYSSLGVHGRSQLVNLLLQLSRL